MSEVLEPLTQEQPSSEAQQASQPTAGALLRSAREATGLHVAALAVSLKVPVKKLEALEADRLDLLPDAVFVRALASSVCRALKVDPAPILAQLPQTTAPRLIPDQHGLNMPFQAPGDVKRTSLGEQLSRPGILVALVLVVGALVLVLFPAPDETGKGASGKASSEVIESVPLAPQAAPDAVAMAAGAAAPAAGANPPPGLPSVAAPAAAGPPPPMAALQPAAATDNAMSLPQTGGLTATGLVVFKTRGPSWVEVTDAQGVVQLRRTLVAGETVGASGALPLSVVVGRVDTTEVQVRGKRFGLEAVTRENVARFEVK